MIWFNPKAWMFGIAVGSIIGKILLNTSLLWYIFWICLNLSVLYFYIALDKTGRFEDNT